MSKNPFDIKSKKKIFIDVKQPAPSNVKPDGYDEIPREKWSDLQSNTYIRWVWEKSGKLDKGGWVRWNKSKKFPDGKTDIIISISANYGGVGDTKYDRVVYGSKIKRLYIKKSSVKSDVPAPQFSDPILEIKENLEVTSELINMQMKLSKFEEENGRLKEKMDKLNADMADLVGFIKKEVSKSN